MGNIYDVVTAPILATKWNERLRERTPFLGEALFANAKQLSTELSYLKGGVQKPKLLNLSAYDAKAIPVDREGFEKKGLNGRRMFEQEFTLEKCIDHLEEIISKK